MNEMIRVNTRLSFELNKWIDEESDRTGLSKSSLIMIAVENFKREKEAFRSMADMGDLVEKINNLEKIVKRNALE